jgi:hypothetical protein
MTTSPYGETDPFATTPPPPQHAATPIGDDLAGDTGLGVPGTGTNTDTDTDSETGAVDSAKETAKDAAGSAADHASDVAATAKDEAAKVATEAKDKAADLFADVKSQADEQSKAQLQNLATKIGELANELDGLVTNAESSGTVTDVAQQLADRTHQLSAHLESRQPLDLLEDVRGFARRRPAAFLAGAAAAGLLAGRLTRGAKASQDSGTTTSTATGTTTVTAPPLADEVPLGQNTGGRQ